MFYFTWARYFVLNNFSFVDWVSLRERLNFFVFLIRVTVKLWIYFATGLIWIKLELNRAIQSKFIESTSSNPRKSKKQLQKIIEIKRNDHWLVSVRR